MFRKSRTKYPKKTEQTKRTIKYDKLIVIYYFLYIFFLLGSILGIYTVFFHNLKLKGK